MKNGVWKTWKFEQTTFGRKKHNDTWKHVEKRHLRKTTPKNEFWNTKTDSEKIAENSRMSWKAKKVSKTASKTTLRRKKKLTETWKV